MGGVIDKEGLWYDGRVGGWGLLSSLSPSCAIIARYASSIFDAAEDRMLPLEQRGSCCLRLSL